MFIVVISGASASGKTSLTNEVLKKLQEFKLDVALLEMDGYYVDRDVNKYPNRKLYQEITNFDSPEVLEFELLRQHVINLSKGYSVAKPCYSFKTAERIGYEEVKPAEILLMEGIFGQYFCQNYLPAELGCLSVHVTTEDYTEMVKRRIERNKKERNQEENKVRERESLFVGPGFFKYTAAAANGADLYVLNRHAIDKQTQLSILDKASNEIVFAIRQRISDKIVALFQSNLRKMALSVEDKSLKSEAHTLLQEELKPRGKKPDARAIIAQSHREKEYLTSETGRFLGFFSGVFGGLEGVAEDFNEKAPQLV